MEMYNANKTLNHINDFLIILFRHIIICFLVLLRVMFARAALLFTLMKIRKQGPACFLNVSVLLVVIC